MKLLTKIILLCNKKPLTIHVRGFIFSIDKKSLLKVSLKLI